MNIKVMIWHTGLAISQTSPQKAQVKAKDFSKLLPTVTWTNDQKEEVTITAHINGEAIGCMTTKYPGKE
jgi:hypothetical protein